MKNLLLILVLALGFSSASASEIGKEIPLDTLVQVINSPTKDIMSEDVRQIIAYAYSNKEKRYVVYNPEIITRGIETDASGRRYKFILLYVKSQNKHIKIMQYPDKKETCLIAIGKLIGVTKLLVKHLYIANIMTEGGYNTSFIKYAAL